MTTSRLFRRCAPAVALLIGLLPVSSTMGQENAAGETPAPSVSCENREGQIVRGPLVRFGTKEIEIGGEAPARLAIPSLLRVSFDGRKGTVPSGTTTLLLDNGDRIVLRADATSDDKLVGRLAATGGTISIPLETIRGIALGGSDVPSLYRATLRELNRGNEKSDLLQLLNGDRLSGELVSIDGAQVGFKAAAGETSVERANVRSLRFNSELISFPSISAAHSVVLLTDASRVTATGIEEIDRERVLVKAAFGGTFELPVSVIVSLRFLDANLVDLGDLEPAEYQFKPFLSLQWPVMPDRNVLGDPLTVRGVEYAKGLGMHSGARATYRLDRKFRRFRSQMAIDDSAGGGGSARFIVEVDGRRVFESGDVRGADAPARCGPIDVAGADQLTLIVEYGERGDVLDHADWLDPVLLK